MTKDEALDKALNALLWANIEINDWRDDAHGYKPEDQPQIMEAITSIKQALAAPVQDEAWKAKQKALAQEALECAAEAMSDPDNQAAKAVREYYGATAQPAPVQEPVAWMQSDEVHISLWKDDYHTIPLYTTPPAAQRQWVGLTDDELRELCDEFWLYPRKLLQAIEAKLKELNT
jgi:hypothetical protein